MILWSRKHEFELETNKQYCWRKVPLEKLCLVDEWNQTHELLQDKLRWPSMNRWIDEFRRQVPLEKLCFVDGRNQFKYLLYQISQELQVTRRIDNISRLYQYLTQEHYLLSRPDESIIIKLIQVKCDYVTISGQIWGWKKIIQESRINISRQKTKKIKTYAIIEEVQKQIKISLELTRKQAKNALKLLLLKKKHIKTDK